MSDARDLLLGIAALLATLAAGLMLGEYWTGFLARCVAWMFLAVSFTVAYAYANVPSVAQATLFGVGAYVTLWTTEPARGSLLFLLLASCAAGFIAALLLGVLLSKMSRNGASIATIIFAVIVSMLGSAATRLTGGADGMALPPARFQFFGLPIAAGPNRSTLALGILLLSMLLVGFWFVSQTHVWLVVRAVQQNAMRAQVLGYPAARYRLLVFGASGAIAGIGGSLYAIVAQHLTTDLLSLFMSLKAIVWAAVGGVTVVFGAPFGVLLVEVFAEVVSRWTFRNDMFVGALLILVALWLPNGLMGLVSHLGTFRRPRMDVRAEVPSAASQNGTETRTRKGMR